jgi:hypothetical protein
MTFGRTRSGLVLALLVAAAASSASGETAPRHGQVAGGEAKQLGRPFPRQIPPPPARKAPRVYVSVVSPRQSSTVFQHVGQQRMQSNAGQRGGGMGGGFPAR